ncbi:hypothetical protein [Streptomyces griseoloalbus]|uniref:Uncharacterized protein n=1 Tax=Streptomyces griseoloalbus TaxID=67303 RepID=A0A7W8BP64_9ACTN|nr:hypothetical protein [Streptomyces albaduncus]MBB5126417.1 hypothetical protein [Streptomyces albaduncus]GGW35090.1 hypothetical protein GCM10010340_10930 [Streptomyces albaduncus]
MGGELRVSTAGEADGERTPPWQLKGDTTAKAEFVGPNCGLCATDWDVLRKNLS